MGLPGWGWGAVIEVIMVHVVDGVLVTDVGAARGGLFDWGLLRGSTNPAAEACSWNKQKQQDGI